MSMHQRRDTRQGGARDTAPRAMGVRAILDWAFRAECVGLELPITEEAAIGRGYGVGSAQQMLTIGTQGVRVDYSGAHTKGGHEDAEVVSGVVSSALDPHTAVRVAEYARSGIEPDWMPGAVPRLYPEATTQRRGQVTAVTKVWEVVTYRNPRRRKLVHREVRYCPCVWSPTPAQIERARANYEDWWHSLALVRDTLQATSQLRRHTVTDEMPPWRPWERGQ